MFHFFAPRGFWKFSIGTEIEHWPRMGYEKKTNLHGERWEWQLVIKQNLRNLFARIGKKNGILQNGFEWTETCFKMLQI